MHVERRIVLRTLAQFAIGLPLGGGRLLAASGVEIQPLLAQVRRLIDAMRYLGEPFALFQPKITFASCLLRLGVLPLLILCIARWLPCPLELKRVLVVQAAMPAAVFPIVLARHYGGQPLTAVQIVLGTTALGVFVSPLWIGAGRAWLGV